MGQGFFALLTADPLWGTLRPEEARGEALFLVPYPLRDLAEAWRLAYRSLGLRRGRVLYLRRREEAFDPGIAQAVAARPLVLLAAEGLPEFLDPIRGSLLLQALWEVHRQGGGVVALGEAAGLLGEAAFYSRRLRPPWAWPSCEVWSSGTGAVPGPFPPGGRQPRPGGLRPFGEHRSSPPKGSGGGLDGRGDPGGCRGGGVHGPGVKGLKVDVLSAGEGGVPSSGNMALCPRGGCTRP